MRMEAGFALVAMMLSRVNGGKAKIEDFMPHKDAPEASIEDIFAGFKKMAADNNARKKRGK